ncbi:MAG TPA: methyltransferase domain-containing protein [Myxococcota bacterium]|nr:methyltransferase domain-containing protein [Myxococcota bacterium]
MSATLYGETEARYAALSGLVHGARVLDLAIHGDARCIDALVTAGAKSIAVCAPEQVRRDLTTQNVELQLVPPVALPLPFGPSSFDVVVCFDLIARIAQDPAWMSGLREVLTPDGAIVIATSSADDAARILGASFGVATVFAQTPLVGHMLYDVGVEELEPELDRTWADGADDEPMSYVVIFAPDTRHNEKLTMVQMPFTAWERLASAEVEALRQERDHLKHDLAAANEHIARSQWQLGGAVNEAGTSEVELANARSELEVAVNELASLRHEAEQLNAGNLTPDELAGELARHRSDRASLEAQIADLLEESAAMSANVMVWEERIATLEGAVNQAEGRASELEAAAARDQAAVAELQDTIAIERGAATQARQAAESERDALKRRLDEVQRALDMSRRRGDDLARSLDLDRQQLAELKDLVDSERQRAKALEKTLNTNSSKEIDDPSGQKAIDGES